MEGFEVPLKNRMKGYREVLPWFCHVAVHKTNEESHAISVQFDGTSCWNFERISVEFLTVNVEFDECYH